jgi:hypothetical protein
MKWGRYFYKNVGTYYKLDVILYTRRLLLHNNNNNNNNNIVLITVRPPQMVFLWLPSH